MAVTLTDVAKECGVDAGSVSVTLRHHPKAMRLREETRQRILDAAVKLGYRRNLLASSVRSGKVTVFGILGDFGPSAAGLSIRQVLPGILQEADELGYTAKVFSSKNLKKAFDNIIGFCVRELIVFTSNPEKRKEIAAFCRKNGIRLIFLFSMGLPGAPAVSTDNFSSARIAVNRLISLGHTRIAYLGADNTFEYQLDRAGGYRAAFQDAGLPVPENLCRFTETPYETMQELLALPEDQRPTAVFAVSDGYCISAQNAAIRAGLSLPDDLAMVGFGDLDSAETAFIPLSTMSETLYENGRKAARLLLAGEIPPGRFCHDTYYIPGAFIQRKSDVPPGKRSENHKHK